MYISPVQNEIIIDCCSIIITEIILKEIKESKFYSVIFDETTDISHLSLMSLVLRYIQKAVVKIFYCIYWYHAYVNNTDTTYENNLEPILNGNILGDTVISLFKKFDLDLKYCVCIETDG